MIPADRVRPEHVRAFHLRMQRKFGSQVFDKNVRSGIEQARDYVKALGVVDATAYLKTYAFTLGVFIWYPFDVMDPAPIGNWTLPNQLVGIGHEHVHVRQFKEYKGLPMASDYVKSAEARAMRWEAEAYCLTLEVWRPLYGSLPPPSPEQVVSSLPAYGCTPEQVQGAAEVVRTRYESIKRGGLLTPEARELVAFLREAQIAE